MVTDCINPAILLTMTNLLRLIFLLAWAGSATAQSVSATYQPIPQIRSPELRQLQIDWRSNRLLEGMAEQLSRQFTLSQPLKIGLGECGMSNAFYKSDAKTIVLCLELIPDLVSRILREQGTRLDRETINNTVVGALVFIVFHELGHAIIDIESLPVLGRNEDAADMISTYLILQEPALADRAVAGGLFFFSKPTSLIPGFFNQQHMSDEHGLNPQRAVNLACAAYGKEPSRFVWAMQAARVTNQRASRCAGEYAQLDRSVRGLLRNVIR
ncbi:MAG: DUF4344 domain-containing metallopeptidase [Candidatus Woesearchaeota archaeon]|nr:DUF4344 domain-containing metallopeptidase [Candidatus Woesearchaeota archaeon]